MFRLNPDRSGFTLIELLVVISIIALMIGILLPVLKTARDTAQATACASQQRQIGIASFGYANDYEGWLPPSNQNPAETPNNGWFWFRLLDSGGYLNSRQNEPAEQAPGLYCPSIEVDLSIAGTLYGMRKGHHIEYDYYNIFTNGVRWDHIQTSGQVEFSRTIAPTPTDYLFLGCSVRQRLLPSFVFGKQTYLFFADDSSQTFLDLFLIHNGTANGLYADGRAQAHKRDALNDAGIEDQFISDVPLVGS